MFARQVTAVGVVQACMVGSAWGQAQLYFGFDQGLGETTALMVPAQTPRSAGARAQFLNSLGAHGTQDLESVALVVTPVTVPIPGLDGVSITLRRDVAGNGRITSLPPGSTDGFGRYPTSGMRYWLAVETAGITFPQPVKAVGFFTTDLRDLDTDFRVRVVYSGGSTQMLSIGSGRWNGGSVAYIGLRSAGPAITSVDFLGGGYFDGFGVDDITVAVPAPGAGVLVVGCVVGIGRRRRGVSP